MRRHEISDADWDRVKARRPTHGPAGGATGHSSTPSSESPGPAARGGTSPTGNPKDRLSSTGTGRSAFAGVYTVRVIFGPPGFPPIRPTTRRNTAAPSRAFGSVSATSHLTFGIFTGMRP